MPDVSRKKSAARSAASWLLTLALILPTLPTIAAGESLSARVRSCASEADSLRRLVCYDKNVAPFAEPTADAKRDGAPGVPVGVAKAPLASKSVAAPDPASPERASAGDEPKRVKPAGAEKVPRHVVARVLSIEKNRGEMVLHLDNGQVWEQMQEATADMNLQAGDTVSIDRNLVGSYWLGGRSEGVMKVWRKE